MGEHEVRRRGPSGAAAPSWRRPAEYALIAALAFGVYANSLSNPFVWDDPLFIVANPSIRSLSHVPSFFTKPWASERAQARYKKQGAIGWRPLALTSYSIDYALFGLSPTGFRISQLLLHLTASLAFLALARSLVPGVASLAVAAIFAVHPLHSEALNVVTYRTTLLFSLFYLLGLAAHVWGRRRGLRWPTLTLVPLAYAASCLSKEPGITLAAAVVWFDLATRRFVWRRVVDYLPLACVDADYLVARALITDSNREIERGALVGPLVKQMRTVPPARNQVDAQGTIIAMLTNDQLVGSGEVVFIDLGEKSGLEVGNRMYVVRRGDAYEDVMGPSSMIGQDDRRFPARALGEVVIVDVGKNVSIGLITLSVQEMGIGDLVMMQKTE